MSGRCQDECLIIQSAICFTILANAHLRQSSSTLVSLLAKSVSGLAQSQIFLETEEFRQAKVEDAIQKEVAVSGSSPD
jgi:hypothetical protein